MGQPSERIPNDRLFAYLAAELGGRISHRQGKEECHVLCPIGGCAPAERDGDTHFSFNDEAGYCFVCGDGISLFRIGEEAGLWTGKTIRSVLGEVQARPVSVKAISVGISEWQTRPTELIAEYISDPQRTMREWQRYKPIPFYVLLRKKYGLGRMPATFYDGKERPYYPGRCDHTRLIVPVFEYDSDGKRGRLLDVRGRALNCPPGSYCADGQNRWLSATGGSAAIHNLEAVKVGSRVILCENMVDADLAASYDPLYVGIAGTRGVGSWKYGLWSRMLLLRRPASVIVWVDNDLAGWANNATYGRLWAERAAKHPTAKEPDMAGPKILADLYETLRLLKSEGAVPLTYSPYLGHHNWEHGTKAGADLGDYICGTEKGGESNYWQRAREELARAAGY